MISAMVKFFARIMIPTYLLFSLLWIMMAIVAISGSSISCAIPRRVKRNRIKQRRLQETGSPTLPYPKPSPTPLLLPSSLQLTHDQFVESAIVHLESTSDHISDDPQFILSIFRHVRRPSYVKRLGQVIPLYLIRREASIFSGLVKLYCDHGFVRNAHHLFDQMPERHKSNTFIWNCLISGYTQLGLYEEAMALYHQMEEDGVPPDRFTFPRVIKACVGIGLVSLCQAIHRHVIRSGFGNDVYVLNALLDMYAKCGDIVAARKVFEANSERDLISWNSMLVCYTQHGFLREAATTLRGMVDARFEPDSVTISTLISGFSQNTSTKAGLEIHAWAIRHGLAGSISVGNSLIKLYSKMRKLPLAREIFELMPKKDLFTWNAIISAHQLDKQIFILFNRMIDSGVKPDKVTFISLLSSCAKLGLVNDGKRLFNEMQGKYNIKPNKEHYSCMVNMLGKAGTIKEAYEVVQRMPFVAGPTIWGALLYACSVHGDVEVGEVAAKKLFDLEPDNEHNFELMARIYRKAGQLDRVERIKRMMLDRGLKLLQL